MNNSATQKLIVLLAFEGPDKAGKSTLMKEVNSQSNYEYLCIDRFTGSAWVYDNLSGRRDREEEIIEFEQELAKLKHAVVINVFVTSNKEVLKKRIQSEDAFASKRLSDLDSALLLYERYFKNVTRLPTVFVDTSSLTIEQTVTEIMRKVHAYVDGYSRHNK